jgi:hypothetical protein
LALLVGDGDFSSVYPTCFAEQANAFIKIRHVQESVFMMPFGIVKEPIFS